MDEEEKPDTAAECESAKTDKFDVNLKDGGTNVPPKNVRPAKEIAAENHHEQTGLHHLINGTSLVLSIKQFQGHYDLHYIPSCAVETGFFQNLSPENSLMKAHQLSSDLIPGEYEGGLKLWECAIDLVNYLNGDKMIELKNRRVFELGCGAGLPGIYCLLNEAMVHFQDYNEEVINLITIPNVFVNCKVHNVHFDRARSKFYVGDWKSLVDLLSDLKEDDRYDCILMSETIYNPDNYEALHCLLKSCLKTTGKIYVAAKTYYFGVGGSTESFKSFVATRGIFKIYPCKLFEEDMRKPYHSPSEAFTEKDLVTKEPIGQFRHWFEEVVKFHGIEEPNAVCLATCTKSGLPSSRMVLLKGFGKGGFKFFTNNCSRKGQELLENPQAALLFYWEPLKRQVRIEGSVVQLRMEEAEEYFHKRPRNSQISAAVSKQSAIITRDELLKKYEAMITEYSDENVPIPKPVTWCGFKVIPEVVEFWQGQSNRLHDRIRFRRLKAGEQADDELIHHGEDGWVYERLAP